MPYEFEDVSKEVSQGSKDVKKNLDELVKSAETADKAYAKLSKTQQTSLVINEKFVKALKKTNDSFKKTDDILKKTNRSLLLVSKSSTTTIKSLKAIDTVSRNVASSLSAISTKASVAGSKFHSASANVSIFASRVDKIGKSAIGAGKAIGNLGNKVKSVKTVKPVSMPVEMDAKGIKDAAEDISDTIDKTIGGRAKKAYQELGDSEDKFYNEMKKNVKTVGDLLHKSFVEGKKDATEFGNGLGKSAAGMTAAGVAAYFVFQKVGDLVRKFEDGAVELARFNAETAALGRTIIGVSGGGLESMRKTLGLTREQAIRFFDVVQRGTNTLGIAPTKLMAVSKALQATFGGDQTARLEKYVDLLESIPSLDTDLDITANFDDKAAALFGLAKQGKMEAVIDLQTAGMFGGAGGQTMPDAKLLNASQQTKATVQNVYDFLTNKMFPSVGPQLSALAENSAKLLSAIGGAVGFFGSMSLFMGTIPSAVAAGAVTTSGAVAAGATATSAAVTASGAAVVSAIVGSRAAGGGLENIIDKAKNISEQLELPLMPAGKGGEQFLPGMAGVGIGTKASMAAIKPPPLPALGKETVKATSSLGKYSKQVLFNVKNLSLLSKVTGGVAIGLGLAGMAATYFGKKLEESGNEVGGSSLELAGGLASFGATVAGFALLGQLLIPIPGLGAAIGALAGVVVGAVSSFEDIGDAAIRFGKSLQITASVGGKDIPKFNARTQAAGIALEYLGKGVSETGKFAKEFGKALLEGTWDTIKFATGFTALESSFSMFFGYNDKYANSLQEATKAAEKIGARMEIVAESTRKYDALVSEESKKESASAMSLQREMKKTENVFKSGKYMLVGFERELAGVKLDAFTKLGGSVSGFDSAIRNSASLVTKKFKMMTEDLEKRRQDIKRNTTLEGSQRRAALQELHKTEMLAALEFVDGMNQVIDAMLQTPSIIEAGLKARMAKAKIEAPMESGTATTKEILGAKAEEYAAARKEQDDTAVAAIEANKMIKVSEKELGAVRLKAMQDQKTAAILNANKIINAEGEIDEIALTKYSAAVKKGIEDQIAIQNDAAKKMPKTPLKDAVILGRAKQQQEGLGRQLESANKGLIKANEGGGKTDTAAAQEKVKNLTSMKTAADDAVEAAQNAYNESMEEAVKKYKSKGGTDILTDILTDDQIERAKILISQKAAQGEKFTPTADNMGVGLKGKEDQVNRLQGEMAPNNEETIKNLKIIKDSNAEIGKLSEQEAAVAPITDARDGLLNNQTKAVEIQEKQNVLTKKVADIAGQSNAALGIGVQEQANKLALLKKEQAIAELTGNPLRAMVEVSKTEMDLMGARLKAAELEIQQSEGVIKDENVKIARAKDVLKLKTDAQGVALAGSEDEVARARVALEAATFAKGNFEKALATQEKTKEEIIREIPAMAKVIEDSLEIFRSSFEGQRITAKFDLSDAIADTATFSSDLAATMKEATAITIAAAKERYKKEQEIIDSDVGKLAANVETRATAAGVSPEEARRIRAEGEIMKADLIRTGMANAEVKYKKAVVEAAARERDIKTDQANMIQDSIGQEMDFLSEIGGSFSRIVELQGMSIDVEKQKLEYAKENLTTVLSANSDSNEVLKAQIAVRNQEFALARKSMGLQKNIMEKMLGAAFGQLGDFGARKQMATDVSLMGVEGTRVKTPSGMYMAGNGMTHEQNTLQRQLGASGIRGAGNAGMMKGLGLPGAAGNPERLPIEDAMEKGLRAAGVDKSTADTASATINLDKRSGTSGSLFTHDEGAQGILGSILGVLGGILNAVKGTAVATTETAKATTTSAITAHKESVGVISGNKVAGDDVRPRAMLNLATGAYSGIENYDRIMTGRVIPVLEKFANKMANTGVITNKLKGATDGAIASVKKLSDSMAFTGGKFNMSANTLGGGKFNTSANTLGGGKFDTSSGTLGGGKFSTSSRSLGGTRLPQGARNSQKAAEAYRARWQSNKYTPMESLPSGNEDAIITKYWNLNHPATEKPAEFVGPPRPGPAKEGLNIVDQMHKKFEEEYPNKSAKVQDVAKVTKEWAGLSANVPVERTPTLEEVARRLPMESPAVVGSPVGAGAVASVKKTEETAPLVKSKSDEEYERMSAKNSPAAAFARGEAKSTASRAQDTAESAVGNQRDSATGDTGSAASVTLNGKIDIHFDDAMFKVKMAQYTSSAEFREAQSRNGVVVQQT